jgi:hypothetical protein
MRFGCHWLIVALILFSCVDSKAGTHGGGIKGGLLISSPFGGDRDLYELKSIRTASLGVFHRYTFSNKISLQTELLYAHKGARGTYNSNEVEINIWYLDLVPSLQYRILDRSTVAGCLYVGPMYSVRLDATVEPEILGNARSTDIRSDIKLSDIGFAIGAKFALPRGANEFGIDLRYSSGFIAPDNTDRNIDLKNRAIAVMLEMYFGKGTSD